MPTIKAITADGQLYMACVSHESIQKTVKELEKDGLLNITIEYEDRQN